MSELTGLVKAATGPDRNLDAMLHHWALDGVGVGYRSDSPAYTASIDAALSLVERRLPGWEWRIGHENSTTHRALLKEPGRWTATADALAKTAPLAILSALLQTTPTPDRKEAGE